MDRFIDASLASDSSSNDDDFLPDIPDPYSDTMGETTREEVSSDDQGDTEDSVNQSQDDSELQPESEDSLPSVGWEEEEGQGDGLNAGTVGEEEVQEQQVHTAPVSGFRVRFAPDGSEVFEFASDSEEMSEEEPEEDEGLQAMLGVEPTVEFALPTSVVASIAHRVNHQHRRAAAAARRRVQQLENTLRRMRADRNQPSSSSRDVGANEGTATQNSPEEYRPGTTHRTNRRKRKKKPIKTKALRIRQPPKPLGPLIIKEDWDGNDNRKEYLGKLAKSGSHRIVINVRDDQQFNKATAGTPKKKLPVQDQSNEDGGTIQEEVQNEVDMDVSISEKRRSLSGGNTRISGYRIAQLQFDRCSMHQWPWRNKSELLEAHPGVTDVLLYVNAQPGASILYMKTKRTLQGEAIAERQGPPPKLSKVNSQRELIYHVTEHYFYHVDPVGVPVDLFSIKGLGSRRTFAIDFNAFDTEMQCFLFDVVLLESVIIGDHDVHEMSTAKAAAAMQEVFANFFGVSPPPDPTEEDARQKEDIDWFYGQIKKYHEQETLPTPDFPLQPPSLKPTLREYQSDAVNWMLFREECLDHLVAHSSSSYLGRVDLIGSFLEKMFLPVQLTKHSAVGEGPSETTQAFYNPYSAYVCWKKPNVPGVPSGGILCDEMGLGKTVETLSLILLNQKPISQGQMDTTPEKFPSDDDENGAENSSSSKESISGSSESSEDEDWGGKRKKANSKVKQKKLKRDAVTFNPTKRIGVRSRRRATSPCEFTAASQDTQEDDKPADNVESSSNQFSPRRLSRRRSKLTALEAIEAELKASKKEKRKPMRNYDALKIYYDSALNEHNYSEMAKRTPKFHGRFYETNVERREFFECFCGEDEEDSEGAEIVKCSICSSSQHAECVGYDSSLKHMFRKLGKSYLCPHCEAMQPPFETKSTLIITPASISHQWIKEIQRHVQHNQLNILFYKGVSEHGYITPAKLSIYDIVITTYSILSSELDYVDLPHCNSSDGRRFRNPKRFMSIPSPLPNMLWWRVCLDEAQMVEGISTKMALMARRLQAVHRWCVTGTPINKGLQDLFGLFIFLQVQPISYELWWNALVRDPFLRKETSLLYELFGQTIWRNGKQDVLDQLGIPPQTEIVHWLNFSPVETHFYKQQFEIGSERIMDKIHRLQRINPEMCGLNSRLSSLDRFTLHGLLAPFLELRQACCHPQIVKGQLISLQKGTLSMEELLHRLVKKTQLQCHEDHRLVVAALNGMAGLYIILNNWKEASEKYREVLQSAEKHKEHFQTDSLQLLHAMDNLAELLDGNHDGIPFTLRDESLRSDAEDVRRKYMRKYANTVKSAQDVVTPLSAAVEEISKQFTIRKGPSWWVAALKEAQKTQKIDKLIQGLKQDLLDVTKKNIKNTQTLANKFADRYGLEHALVPIILGMDKLRFSVLEGLGELLEMKPETIVESAIRCHLRQKSTSYYNDSDGEGKCKLCVYHDNFLTYESVIFKQNLKNKIDRTGRNFQQRKLLGELADELSEVTKDELLLQETEDLKATTEHVQLLNEELTKGTWGESEAEVILKGILRFAKINKLSHEIKEDGGTHVKLIEAMKKEFRFLRILWRQIYDQVSALDELSQATTRLIAVQDHIENIQEPSTSALSRNVKELRSGAVEKTLKIQNIHVISYHEVEPKLQQLQLDFATGESGLAIHLGQLLYLKTLKKNGYGKKGTVNSEDCPICSTQLGKEWSVLRCGHSFCSDCVKKMCPNALHSFLCPLCRHSMKFADVSFVDTTENEEFKMKNAVTGEESSKKVREIKGSHSTKVGAIVETLLQLQETHPTEKCIIFSTWSEVLNIIAEALKENDIKYSLLNRAGGRGFNTDLNKFKEREDLQVLLMPLTSGSKGLNIIEATHVLLVEPILNLASELQAIGRVHRIGQTKPTFVHRFYIKRTIEEKLFQILKAQDVCSDEEGSLTICDLKTLVSSATSTSPSCITID